MKLYFVRHGETDASAKMLGGQFISELDEPLNALGIQQANDLAEQLKTVQFDVIISSPYKRAYGTAEIVNKYHSLAIKTDTAWREREAGDHLDTSRWHEMFDFDKNITVPDGESLQQFWDRVYAAIDKLKREYATKTVLLTSHGGVHHALYAYANKLPLKGNMRLVLLKNCEYRIYDL